MGTGSKIIISSVGFFELLEGLLYAVDAVFAALLFALSLSAYRNSRLKNLIYAVGAFFLFVIFLIYEYMEHTYDFDSPLTDVVVPLVILAILVLFFLGIIKRNTSVPTKIN